eukprot:GHVP01068183.1.p1 GENE.GHVP01068183.1~~GHVP01068183.1.p1  ORF type:complete len:156 (-),score=19.54 GHVP01068183.1:745-1212(-)
MQVNRDKCEIFELEEEQAKELMDVEIPIVNEYSYLGVVFNKDFSRESRLTREKRRGAATLEDHKRVLRNPNILLLHKTLVLKGIILPAILYGAEVKGCTAVALKETSRVLSKAIIMTIGRGIAMAALRRDLGIPSVQAIVAGKIETLGERLKQKK